MYTFQFSVSVVSHAQQYTNIEAVSKSTLLPSCNNDTAMIFLDTSGKDNTGDGQGFVTVCLKKNSSIHGWALIRDDNHMTEQLKLWAMHAACRQYGYFGSPEKMPGTGYV